jgi:hypothetical protein
LETFVNFWVLDERNVWYAAALAAAFRFGYRGKRIFSGAEVEGEGVGFIRPHADPVALRRNQRDFSLMAERLLMVQDAAMVETYESKSEQFRRWGAWMPLTVRITALDAALEFLAAAPYPLVSKADVGASSVNVRILKDATEAARHVHEVFGPGVIVHHCAGGGGGVNAKSVQHDYVLLSEFIPHEITWRVNAIGNARAVFMRHNYPDRPVAQTGNTVPVKVMTPQVESLLEYADAFFAEVGTRWCALDILWDAAIMEWRLLESSLAWPWPSPGDCNAATLFRSPYTWIDMWDCMFSEIENGAWAYKPSPQGAAA